MDCLSPRPRDLRARLLNSGPARVPAEEVPRAGCAPRVIRTITRR